jgi:ATP-binding cassette, subfamily F, member 3
VIQLEGVSKGYGGQSLFDDLWWQVGDSERIGLVGPNGAGKTTLCRILAGLEEPDAGRVVQSRDATVGYLPQEVAGAMTGSVLAEALSGFEAVWRLEREMEAAARALETAPDAALTARYGELQQRFESLGGYRLENQAKVILSGLGFPSSDLSRPLPEFSGGWRMRAALARLLLLRPSLLLLDEPTNHLDLESLEWLEDFLAEYPGTVIVVSHDRYFLNRMVTSVAELGPDGLALYPGNYDSYLEERDARRELLEARARNEARRVAEIERFIERFRSKATKARQVQSRVKMLDRMDRVELRREARHIHFAFPEPPRTGRRVVSLRAVHKSYGDLVVYAGVDFDAERGERVALVGPNGAGKSTLLRMLAGVLPFERGERALGAHVNVHYYAQHQLDALVPERTVLEELETQAAELGQTRLRTILGAFLFSGDAVDKRVAVLSGGEKARLALAKMLVRPAALLALDEPTNHLDLASREVLEAALAGFAGTIVFISHDRYFINRLATRVVDVDRGRLTDFPGGYDDYLAAKAGRAPSGSDGTAAPANDARPGGRLGHNAVFSRHPRETPSGRPKQAPAKKALPARAKPGAPGARGLASSEARKLRARLGAVEQRIHQLEQRLAEIGRELGDPELYRDGERARAVAAERQSAETEVAWLMREWEELASALPPAD